MMATSQHSTAEALTTNDTVLSKLAHTWGMTREQLLTEATNHPLRVEDRAGRLLMGGGAPAALGLSRLEISEAVERLLGSKAGERHKPETPASPERRRSFLGRAAPELEDLYIGGNASFVQMSRLDIALMLIESEETEQGSDPATPHSGNTLSSGHGCFEGSSAADVHV